MPEHLNPEKFDDRRENTSKEAVELAQRVLDKLFYPLYNERDRINKAIEAEFEAIRAKGGWMYHESSRGSVIDDAANVILKNTNRDPDVGENIQNIENLLKRHKDVSKDLQQYLNINSSLHNLLMTAIQDPGANIKATDIQEVLKERGISI
ncbi:TPA: hypothetical protein DEB72_01565 [Patescibacteria group bacterium]|nr:hypothetical protein [Patescibacteria group bacterium]